MLDSLGFLSKPAEFTHDAVLASLKALFSKLHYLTAEEIERVRQACYAANEAHQGQRRKNGDPYVTHPIEVAAQCAHWHLDEQALTAALMHDAMEDCGITKAQLCERFGPQVADLVDGLTKLDKLEFFSREHNQAESFRKMLLAMGKDIRVILIKIADRAHNMRTMRDVRREQSRRVSRETLEIYAPMAYRLGLHSIYRELQDLAFEFFHPWRYAVLAKTLEKSRQRSTEHPARDVQKTIEAAFMRRGMAARVSESEKPLYAIYRQMQRKRLSFAQVAQEISALSIVVPSLDDCYVGLGVLHQLYRPVVGRFRDHIAAPKVNGQQSLSTVLLVCPGVELECELRERAMDELAEAAVAARWVHRSGQRQRMAVGPSSSEHDAASMHWIEAMLDIEQETPDTSEFWEHIKTDLVVDAIDVLTPAGHAKALPRGATAVDFAYAIHSSVGQHAVAAQINGEHRPLNTPLAEGDVVHIVTDAQAGPHAAWLSFVKTGRARSKIRHHLKAVAQEQLSEFGAKVLAQALRADGISKLPSEDGPGQAVWEKLLRFTGNKNRDELLADIGMGKRIASVTSKKLAGLLVQAGLARPDALLMTTQRYALGHEQTASQGVIVIDGSEGGSVQYAACCRPIPGDRIVGYLGGGEGLMVHMADCPQSQALLQRDSERFLEVEWALETTRGFDTVVIVTLTNGKGALARVASAISLAQADISHVDMGSAPSQTPADLRFTVSVRDRHHLADVLRRLKRTPSVLRARRLGPASRPSA